MQSTRNAILIFTATVLTTLATACATNGTNEGRAAETLQPIEAPRSASKHQDGSANEIDRTRNLRMSTMAGRGGRTK